MICRTHIILLFMLSLIVEIQCQCRTHNAGCVKKKGQDQVITLSNMLKSSFLPPSQNMHIVLQRYLVTKYRVKRLTIPSSEIRSYNIGKNIRLTFGGIAMHIEASWSKKNLFWTDRGNFRATMSDCTVTVLYPKSDACTSTKLLFSDCSAKLNHFNFKITGRMIGWLLRAQAPKKFEAIIHKEFCRSVSALLSKQLNKWSC